MAKAHQFEITPNKTYATKENAIKAVEKKYGNFEFQKEQNYFIMKTDDNRYFPVFIGERAIHGCIHFNFNVVA